MSSEAKRVGPAATGRHSGSSGHNNKKAPGLQQLWQEYLRMLQEKPVVTKVTLNNLVIAVKTLVRCLRSLIGSDVRRYCSPGKLDRPKTG